MGASAWWLAGYCVLILVVSLLGGWLPFLGRVTHGRLQFYLTASAGVMLGAAFFHVMPEAIEYSEGYFGWWMALAVIGLFCIERFIAPHSHEVENGHHHDHDHGTCEHDEAAHKQQTHDHAHGHMPPPATGDGRAAAPSMAGWMAVLGLTIHTFMNGVGLAGAVQADAEHHPAAELAGQAAHLVIPGLAMFLAIVLHKPADALAISVVLSRKGTARGKLTLVQLGFALMVPIGVAAYYLLRGATPDDEATGWQKQVTGAALAFSAGTFLFIALSDLLPEVQFHRHDRIPLFLTLVAAVGLMGGIAYLEGHEHGGHVHGAHSGHQEEHHGEHGHEAHDEDHGN